MEISLEDKIKHLEKQLTKFPQKKRISLLKMILVTIICPLILPLIPSRRSKGTLADYMGYQESVILSGILFIIIAVVGYENYMAKINDEMLDIEYEIDTLKSKIKERENL